MTVAKKLTRAVHAAREHAQPQEARLTSLYEEELRRVARAAAASFRSLVDSITADANWHAPTVDEVLAISFRDRRIKTAQRAMLKAVGAKVGDVPGVDFSLTHPVVQGILDNLGARVPGTISAAAREPVARAIAASWGQGLSVPDTAAAIQSSVEGVAGSKAVMLARTDLIGMSNGSGNWAAQQLNQAADEAGEGTPIQVKTWLSSQDDRVRDTHAEADGQTVPIDQPYQVGEALLMFPGDPDGPDEEVINCRCTELYDEEYPDANSPDAETASGLQAVAEDIAANRSMTLSEARAQLLGGEIRSEPAVPFTEDEEVTMRTATAESGLAAAANESGRRQWHSDIAFEGIGTGDGRFMLLGSMRWREPPLTLMGMVETPDFGGHAGAQVTGRMDTFTKRDQNMDGDALPDGERAVYSTGVFDTGDYGSEVERMVGDETLRGISVDLAIMEWGFRDPDTGEMFDPEEMTPAEWDRAFMGELDFAVIDAEIMAATVCPTPAFADARIALLASALARHAPLTWIAGDEYAAANGVRAGQLMTTLVASCAMVEEDAMTAAGTVGLAPLAPPREWFFTPEAAEPTPLTVTDDGQVFGHIALWSNCHTGFINGEWSECVRPPRSKTDYARFHVGEMVTKEGDHLSIGKLTVGTSHAPMNATPNATRDHYDNTGSVGAFIRAHDGEHGIWVCGATRNDMTGEQLRDLRANPPSGDWRSVDHNLELHAALAVPVPGFNVPRSQIALAASGAGGALEVVALILTASIGTEPETVEPAEVSKVNMASPALLAAMIEGPDGLDDFIQGDDAPLAEVIPLRKPA